MLRRRSDRSATVRVLLTRKLADRLDEVDVSGYKAGDIVELPRGEAELLIAEGWAVAVIGAAAE